MGGLGRVCHLTTGRTSCNKQGELDLLSGRVWLVGCGWLGGQLGVTLAIPEIVALAHQLSNYPTIPEPSLNYP